MINAGIIGTTGFAGIETARILLCHPFVEKIFLASSSAEGKNICEIFPSLIGTFAKKTCGELLSANEVMQKSDVIFTALPNGLAEEYADFCLKNGKKLIDLSADFRFGLDEKTFCEWYKTEWKFPETHKKSVYGIPEMNREKIRGAQIVGNAGCYVTAATLALLPAIKENILCKNFPIIVDAKSGVSGAGKNPTAQNHFCECGESFCAYKVGAHRHRPEIEKNLQEAFENFNAQKSKKSNENLKNPKIASEKNKNAKNFRVIFTPHLLPISRGILSTVYAQFSEDFLEKTKNFSDIEFDKKIREIYSDFYAKEPFVRVLPAGFSCVTKNVRQSNFCDIQTYAVSNRTTLEIVSVIDNIVKGAAGQAVQNMNLMFGFDETCGLEMIPSAF